MESYETIIELLSSQKYYKAQKLINILVNDKKFLNFIACIDNPWIFDRFMKILEYKIDTQVFYETRNSYIRKMIFQYKEVIHPYLKNIRPDNYIKYYLIDSERTYLESSGNYFKQAIENISNRWLTENIITYFFQDNYYNFMTNLYQMINYLERTKKTLVSIDNINKYLEFKNLLKMSIEEKIVFFKKNCYLTNLMELFYDDMRKIKDDSYFNLVNYAVKLTKNSNLYSNSLSKDKNIDIYYLNGEEFYAFVKCFDISVNSKDFSREYLLLQDNRLGYSFSYISHNNIGTVDYNRSGVTLLYDSIDPNQIMYVHHADIHSKKMYFQDEYLSVKENELLTPEQLIAKTKNYNEIYIKNSHNSIKPTALVCYDQITDNDIIFARKNNLSILLMNTSKYKRYENYDEDYTENSYLSVI